MIKNEDDNAEPYVILRADNAMELADFVNAGIEKGYWPIGGPFIDRDKGSPYTNAVSYYQALTRKRHKIIRRRATMRPNPFNVMDAYDELPESIKQSLSIEGFSASIKLALDLQNLFRKP